jgi:hypothetical protein
MRGLRAPILASMVLLLTALLGAPASASSGVSPTVSAASFTSCMRQLQGNRPHAYTLAEAKRCGPGLRIFTPGAVRTAGHLPSIFIVSRGDGGAALVTSGAWQASSTSAGAGATQGPAIPPPCSPSYTWAYPLSTYNDGDVSVRMSAAGYGNHCNYANIPQYPNVSATCAYGSAFCTSTGWTDGHADSTWDNNNYGINSALAWSNITVHYSQGVFEYVYCRGYVNTVGSLSPSPWCST